MGIILVLLVLPLVLDSDRMAGRFGDGKVLIQIWVSRGDGGGRYTKLVLILLPVG